jgi:hypothetical protein
MHTNLCSSLSSPKPIAIFAPTKKMNYEYRHNWLRKDGPRD